MTVQWVKVDQVPLAGLTPFPGNARRGDIGKIRSSVRRNGQYRSLVVRDDGGQLVILAGNNTAQALEAEGWDAARCEIITCTDEEAARINLADNRLSDLATYDDRMLAGLLDGMSGDYEGSGFDEPEVTELLRVGGVLAEQATSFLNGFHQQWPSPPPQASGEPPAAPGLATGQEEVTPAPAGEETPAGNRWVQVSWMVDAGQRDLIHKAVTKAKTDHDLQTSAEAVTVLARAYLGMPPVGDP